MQAEVELALDARRAHARRPRARILADLGAYLWPSTAHPAAHRRDADVRLLRRAGGRGRGHGRADRQGADRPVPRRRAPRGQRTSLERTVDEAARTLGIDPVELRRRNLVRDVPVPERRSA